MTQLLIIFHGTFDFEGFPCAVTNIVVDDST